MKRRKLNVLGLIGLVLIVGGITMIVYELGTNYLEKKEVQASVEDFFNQPTAGLGEAPERAEGDVFGTIKLPDIGVEAPIVQSENWDYLNRYVVAWPNRTLDSGNFAIAGHNGACASCLFRDLDKLAVGDALIITTREAVYTYEIFDNFNVHYTDVSVLDDDGDKTTVTLVSCEEASTSSSVRVIIKAGLKEVKPR